MWDFAETVLPTRCFKSILLRHYVKALYGVRICFFVRFELTEQSLVAATSTSVNTFVEQSLQVSQPSGCNVSDAWVGVDLGTGKTEQNVRRSRATGIEFIRPDSFLGRPPRGERQSIKRCEAT